MSDDLRKCDWCNQTARKGGTLCGGCQWASDMKEQRSDSLEDCESIEDIKDWLRKWVLVK